MYVCMYIRKYAHNTNLNVHTNFTTHKTRNYIYNNHNTA